MFTFSNEISAGMGGAKNEGRQLEGLRLNPFRLWRRTRRNRPKYPYRSFSIRNNYVNQMEFVSFPSSQLSKYYTKTSKERLTSVGRGTETTA
jgi:hypothetical protein